MRNDSHIFLLVFMLLGSVSCVSKKKHDKSQHRKNKITEIEERQISEDVDEKEHLQIFPLGEGAGIVGADQTFLEESAKTKQVEEGFNLSEDNKTIQIILASMVGSAIAVKAGSKLWNNKTVKGMRIEAGISSFDYATRKAHFHKKAASNLKKITKDPSYAFSEIHFGRQNMNRFLGENHKGIPRNPTLKVDLSSKTGEGHIFLGILPNTKIINDVKGKSSRPLSVLSIVEKFELMPFKYRMKDSQGNIVTKTFNSFSKKNVDGAWEHIRSPDYHPVPGGLLDQGADFINLQIRQGKSVYVHCKSGKGRSASMVAAYLMKHKNLSADQAIALIYSQRNHVSIAKTGIFGNHNRTLKKFEEALRHGEFKKINVPSQ